MMLTHLRNIMPVLSRKLSRSKSTFVEPIKNPTLSCYKTSISAAPQWGVVVKELEEHFKNHQISKILKAIPQHKEQLEQTKPEVCDRASAIAISRICTLFAIAENGSAANRDEGKFWYKYALKFNQDNEKAQRGLLCILAEEGDPSMTVTFYAPIASKFK